MRRDKMARGRDHMTLKVGDTFSNTKQITDKEIRAFADLVSDYNPIHLDDEYAAKTRFGRRIAHGMLTAGLISGVLGYQLSERRILYLGQTLKFTAPVFVNDTITATAVVKNIREDKPVVTLDTTCTNQNGETVLRGEATIMML
jgi:3-hydroxybutyryl-CoA dehydratase